MKRKYHLTLDVEFEFDTAFYEEWEIGDDERLRRSILMEYFLENGTKLNQDIQIEEITDETKN